MKALVFFAFTAAVFAGGTATGLWMRTSDHALAKAAVEKFDAWLASRAEVAHAAAPAKAPSEGTDAAASEETPAVPSEEATPQAAAAPSADPRGWANLDDASRYEGHAYAAKELAGKVVLVYLFDAKNADSVAQLDRIQEVWTSYAKKPFVILGSHRGGRDEAGVRKALRAHGVSFSVYEGVAYGSEPHFISTAPYLYIVDHAGKVCWRGRDARGALAKLADVIPDAVLAQGKSVR